MDFFKLITVEPVLFMQMVGDTLTYVIYQNLFIDKICRTELNYGEEVCDRYASFNDESLNASSESWITPIKNQIQESSASFVLYNSLVENSLPMIIVLLLGVWSDAKRKRKPLFLFALFGKFFHSLGLLLNAWFMDWSPMLLLLTSTLPYSIGGAKVVFHMATYSYIADSSIARHRTWRLSIAEAIFNVGAWIGLALGANLFKKFGYICVFATSVVFHLIAIIYTIFIVPEISQKKKVAKRYPDFPQQNGDGTNDKLPIKNGSSGNNLTIRISHYCSDSDLSDAYTSESGNKNGLTIDSKKGDTSPLLHSVTTTTPTKDDIKSALIPKSKSSNSIVQYMYGTFRPVFRRRSNHTRLCVILMGTIMLLYGVSGNGEASMTYLYTRYKFQWREQQFSYWRIFDSVMTVLGLGIVMPLFTRLLKFSDPLMGAIAAVGRFFAVSCLAFAPVPIYLFAGSVLDIFGVLMPIAARSMASKCVLTNERGRVFAFLGCIEAVARLVSVPLYSVIYSATLTVLTSTIYYLSMSMYFTVIVIFSSLFVARRLKLIEYEPEGPVPETIIKIFTNGNGNENISHSRRNSLP